MKDYIGPTTLLNSLSKGREGSIEDGIGPTTSSTNGFLGEGPWEGTRGYQSEITMCSNNCEASSIRGKR
jgi:hypothetical protein